MPARRLTTSTLVESALSPDGSRLLLSRSVPTGAGASERRYSLLPFAGGGETALNIPGGADRAGWDDSVTLRVARQVAGGTRAGLLDVRSGAMSRTVTIPDSLLADVRPVPDGWAWIPNGKDRVRIERAGKTVDIAKPAWFGELNRLAIDARENAWPCSAGTREPTTRSAWPWPRSRAARPRCGQPTRPSSATSSGSTTDRCCSRRGTRPSRRSWTRSAAPAAITRLGRISRPSAGISVSPDLKRISVVERNYHGDAFTSRIVRR